MPACCDKCQGPRDKSCGEKHRPFQIKVNWQPRFTAEARNYEFDRASDPLECPLGCKKTWAQYGRYISITRHIKRAHKEIVLNASASTSSTISLAYVAVPMESSYEALSAELRATETDSLPSPNEPKPKRVVKSAHKRRLIVSDEESDGNSGISRSVDFAGAHKRRIIVSDEESDDNGGISRFLSFKNDGEQGSAGASDEGRRRTSRTSSPNGVIIVPRQPAVSRARIRKPVESNQVLDQVQSSPGRLGPWPSPLLGPHAENDQCSPNSGRRTVSPLPQSLSPRTPAKITNLRNEAISRTAQTPSFFTTAGQDAFVETPAKLTKLFDETEILAAGGLVTSQIRYRTLSTSPSPSLRMQYTNTDEDPNFMMGSDQGSGMIHSPLDVPTFDMPLTPSDNSQNDHVTDYLQSRDRRDSPEYSDHDEVMLAPEGAGSDFPEDDVPKEGNSLRRSDRGGVELPMTPTTASEDPAKPEEPDSVGLCPECSSPRSCTVDHLWEADHPLSFTMGYNEDQGHHYKAKMFRCFPDLKFYCICGDKFSTLADGRAHIAALDLQASGHVRKWKNATMKGRNVPRKPKL